jgi:hypothetical protein
MTASTTFFTLLTSVVLGVSALVATVWVDAAPQQVRTTGAGYRGPMTLRAVLADLIGQEDKRPTAQSLRDRYGLRATSITIADEQLDAPAWAKQVTAADIFLETTGELAGIQLSDDSRGWFSTADIAVVRGTLADIEAVTGPTEPMPPNPDDFISGPRHGVIPSLRGLWPLAKPRCIARVIVELADWQGSTRARRVTVYFDRAP